MPQVFHTGYPLDTPRPAILIEYEAELARQVPPQLLHLLRVRLHERLPTAPTKRAPQPLGDGLKRVLVADRRDHPVLLQRDERLLSRLPARLPRRAARTWYRAEEDERARPDRLRQASLRRDDAREVRVREHGRGVRD